MVPSQVTISSSNTLHNFEVDTAALNTTRVRVNLTRGTMPGYSHALLWVVLLSVIMGLRNDQLKLVEEVELGKVNFHVPIEGMFDFINLFFYIKVTVKIALFWNVMTWRLVNSFRNICPPT
jgi:hypothetical protein